jgi:hypothetical protein
MFSYDEGKRCGYHCPEGFEFDPISNFAKELDDPERNNPTYQKYYSKKNTCKECRIAAGKGGMIKDCGISCVIQSNSLSFVTILNIYSACKKA